MMFKGNTPTLFATWLKSTMLKFIPYSKDENFVFINAWNEWAEGNHLEPDVKWGNQFLNVLKQVVESEKQ